LAWSDPNGCLEEVAYRKGFIDRDQMKRVIEDTPKSSYREYLETVVKDKGRLKADF